MNLPVVLLSAIASLAPAAKSSAAGTSRIEIVSRECSVWMTPTLISSGSAVAAAGDAASAAIPSAVAASRCCVRLRV